MASMESTAQLNERTLLAHQQPVEENDEIDLLKLWSSIWRRKWSILSLMLAVMLVTALAVLTITPTYRATTTLLIEQQKAKVVSIEQVYGLEGNTNEYLQTQFELLRSRALAERVVRQLNLTTHPEFDPRQQPEPLVDLSWVRETLNFHKAINVTSPEDLLDPEAQTEAEIFDKVVRDFMEVTSIAQQGKSQLVTVSVDMADARTAALASNALAKGFIESQLEASMAMSATATDWMNSRLGELRDKLKEAEDRLQAYRQKENLVDVDGVASIVAGELNLPQTA